MTRLARIFVGSVASWRPLAPFVALFVLLLLFAVGGMLVIAHEADRSDAHRRGRGWSDADRIEENDPSRFSSFGR